MGTMRTKLEYARRAGAPDELLRAVACACCRQAWDILPEGARSALVAAEMFCRGEATDLGLREAELRAEAAAPESYAVALACRAVALACRPDSATDRNGYGMVCVPAMVSDALTAPVMYDWRRSTDLSGEVYVAQANIMDGIIPPSMIEWLRVNAAPEPQDTVIRDGFVLSGADPDKITFNCACCDAHAHVPIGWTCAGNNPEPHLFCPACTGTADAQAVVDAAAAWNTTHGEMPSAEGAADDALQAYSTESAEWREQYRATYAAKWQRRLDDPDIWTADEWDAYQASEAEADAYINAADA